jgi:hypothetical protein
MLRSNTLRPLALAAALAVPQAVTAANHREAPITAIDRTADITDWYTFVSYDNPGRVTLIMAADPPPRALRTADLLPVRYRDPLHVPRGQQQRRQCRGRAVRSCGSRTRLRVVDPRCSRSPWAGIAGIPPITPSTGLDPEGLGLRQTYTVHSVQGRSAHRPHAGTKALRRAVQRRPADHAELLGARRALRAGDLHAAQGVKAFAGTTDDAVLHRPGRGLRLPELPDGRGGRRP